MSWNAALIGKAILATAIASLCPSVALADVVPATLLASGDITIPSSPSSPESITFSDVQLTAGQTYWVAVLPNGTTSGALWQQNTSLVQLVDFTGDGVNWLDNFYPSAHPGEFDVIGSSNNVLFSNMAATPLATDGSWGIAGQYVTGCPYASCYNGYASYFTPSVSGLATEVDVVLFQNNGYAPYATVALYTSSENIASTPEPAEGTILGGFLMLLLGARSWYRRIEKAGQRVAPSTL